MGLFTKWTPHPGELLREELEARDWSQRDFAYILGVPEQSVNYIVSGKRGISPEMAKSLGAALGVSDEFYANMQKAYDLARAREPDPSVAKRAKFQSAFPLREMIKRSWITETNDQEVLEAQLAEFFEVEDTNKIPSLNHAAKKQGTDHITPIQLAWLSRVRQIAKAIHAPNYSEKALKEILPEIKKLLGYPEETRKVPGLLMDAGVKFVAVEGLPASKIDGVCTWLGATPVIGMTLRRDSIDNFWFVLRHEIEHVLRKDGKDVEFIDEELGKAGDESNIPKQERIANAASTEFIVPQDKLNNFIVRKSPMYSAFHISQFAESIGIHPGLVVGQLQFRGEVPYTHFHKYLPRIRNIVTSTAITDGWDSIPNI